MPAKQYIAQEESTERVQVLRDDDSDLLLRYVVL